ncbi:hypothetical protein [Leuconostoc citreum]
MTRKVYKTMFAGQLLNKKALEGFFKVAYDSNNYVNLNWYR